MDTIWATSFFGINTGKKFLSSGKAKSISFNVESLFQLISISYREGSENCSQKYTLKSSTLSIALLRKVKFLCIVSGILWQVFLVLRWDQNYYKCKLYSNGRYISIDKMKECYLKIFPCIFRFPVVQTAIPLYLF